MCDISESCYQTAKRFISEYDAYGVNSMVNDMQAGDVIADGSSADGRKPLAVKELKAHRDFCVAIVAWYETTQINTKSVLTLVVGASVNGSAKF